MKLGEAIYKAIGVEHQERLGIPARPSNVPPVMPAAMTSSTPSMK